MGQRISLFATFSAELEPAVLIKRLLQSGFTQFFQPKVGGISFGDKRLALAEPQSIHQRKTLAGEVTVAPGLSALLGYPNAAPMIIDFIGQTTGIGPCILAVTGDLWFSYLLNRKIVQGPVARYISNDEHLSIIHLTIQRPPSKTVTAVILNFGHPAPLLTSWWPDSTWPSPFNDVTAEANWKVVLNMLQAVIRAADDFELHEMRFDFEGATVYAESDRLIAAARDIPKLEISYSN